MGWSYTHPLSWWIIRSIHNTPSPIDDTVANCEHQHVALNILGKNAAMVVSAWDWINVWNGRSSYTRTQWSQNPCHTIYLVVLVTFHITITITKVHYRSTVSGMSLTSYFSFQVSVWWDRCLAATSWLILFTLPHVIMAGIITLNLIPWPTFSEYPWFFLLGGRRFWPPLLPPVRPAIFLDRSVRAVCHLLYQTSV